MFALSAPIGKSFEIWPGKITFAAEGAGAPEALDAATDMARALCRAVIEDAELLASGDSVLPRGQAGRHAAEVAALFGEIQGVELPPVVALPGAVCDVVLEVMREAADRAGGADFIAVSLGEAVAIHKVGHSLLPVNSSLPPMSGEFLRALGPGVPGGAALGGVHSTVPTRGAIDLVATFSRNAAMAGFAAAMIAIPLPIVSRRLRACCRVTGFMRLPGAAGGLRRRAAWLSRKLSGMSCPPRFDRQRRCETGGFSLPLRLASRGGGAFSARLMATGFCASVFRSGASASAGSYFLKI